MPRLSQLSRSVADRVVLVTGAASGMGRATAHLFADEGARVAVRNVRRDGMDSLKTDEKKGDISEDERKRLETEVQKLTDATIVDIDAAASAKEKEILGQ